MSKYMAKGALRSVKNMTRGYSGMQAKVREATSNDPWGPSGSQMSEIARATFDPHHFQEIMDMIDKRLNDKGKNWRHVFKALTLLDYCLHSGSQNVIAYARDNFYIVKTLKEFQFIDEHGKDQGANVRQKAKDIISLLSDESRLREERNNRSTGRNSMHGSSNGDTFRYGAHSPRRSSFGPDDFAQSEEDRELQRAIEESKRSAEEHEKRLKSSDEDIQKAIELSKQEAIAQSNKVSETNELIQLDDSPRAHTGINLYQQQQHDVFGNTNNFSNTNNNVFDLFDPLQSNFNNTMNSGRYSAQAGGGSNNPFASPQQSTHSFNDSGFQAQPTAFFHNQADGYENNIHSFSIPSSNPFYQQSPPVMNSNDPFNSVGRPGPNNPFGDAQQQLYSGNTLIAFEPSHTGPNANFGNVTSKNPFASSESNTWNQSKPSLNDLMRQQKQSYPFANHLDMNNNIPEGNNNYTTGHGQPFHQPLPYGTSISTNNNPFGF